ncbi:MAG: hypothetical protein JW940_17865 [Polyangiaceae bacterium]|nr:hypothetical protein [Polyangiaceae bacterium]
MLRLFSARTVELVVLLFAVLGFMFVPLGKRTGFEHARAVLSTSAAVEAGQELYGAMVRVGDRLRKAWQPTAATPPGPVPAQWRGTRGSRRLRTAPAGPRDAGAADVSL